MTATTAHFCTERAITTTNRAEQFMTSAPRPRAVSDLTLAATSTAANVSLLFLQHTLSRWHHLELARNGAAVLSEMVSEAVKLTGVPHPSPRWIDLDDLALLWVRLVLFDHAVVVEVADRHREPPDSSAVFRSRGTRWNFYPTQAGRVVWCELELPQHELTERGLPKRHPSPVQLNQQPPNTPVDRALLQRVLEGLEKL